MLSATDKNSNHERLPAVFILAGGLGTRLGDVARDRPKAMVPVLGEPFVAHQLRLLQAQGFTDVVLCTGHLGQQIEDFIGDGDRFGLTVRYSREGEQLLGTGGALKRAVANFSNEQVFAVIYGDSYLDIPVYPVFEAFSNSGKDALMTVLHNRNQWGTSNVRLSEGHSLPKSITYYNKTAIEQDLEYIDFGISFLRSSVFDDLNCGSLETPSFDLTQIWQALIAKGQLAGFAVKQRFYEVGNPQALKETEEYISRRSNLRF